MRKPIGLCPLYIGVFNHFGHFHARPAGSRWSVQIRVKTRVLNLWQHHRHGQHQSVWNISLTNNQQQANVQLLNINEFKFVPVCSFVAELHWWAVTYEISCLGTIAYRSTFQMNFLLRVTAVIKAERFGGWVGSGCRIIAVRMAGAVILDTHLSNTHWRVKWRGWRGLTQQNAIITHTRTHESGSGCERPVLSGQLQRHLRSD